MALSQMMQHWAQIKEEYPDCIIFYRLGDFYEMFFDDAKTASKVLELTLTGRDCGLEERAPMCGVPFHASEGYVTKLVTNGYKVAICEQLEEATKGKGMVARGVIRVVTPGTLTDYSHLDENKSNYIACVYKNDQLCSLAWSDITTGEFSVIEYLGQDCVSKVIEKLLNLSVSEIICNDDMLIESRSIPEVTRGILPPFSNYLAWAFNFTAAENILLDQFNTKTLAAFSISGKQGAISAAGALISYLKDTQKHALSNINNINYISDDCFLIIDSTAAKNLELIKNNADMKKYGSLLWVLDKTKTAMGARRLNQMVLSPLRNQSEINYRLDGVEELYKSPVIRIALSELLKEVKDIERIAGKISNNTILPRDCLLLADSLRTMPNFMFQLSGFSSEIINDVVKKIYDLHDVIELIDSTIMPMNLLPPTMKDGGYIKDGYNEQLDQCRAIKEGSTQLLTDLESRERDVTGVKSLKVKYNRVFGYMIEIPRSVRCDLPLEYERKQTLANAERYVTPELKALEEKILNSEELALKLEAEIYLYVRQILASKLVELKEISEAISILDILTCFAEISQNNKYVRPLIVDSREQLIIKDGRHPVIEAISKDRFISNDTVLDEDENRTMIITGPNMAGKSTYMRQVAVITIMAHLGCFVPAKSAQIPLVDRIFTRVGASDNLIFDQSTFMVEMIEVASILQNATKNSLLLLDEVGRGTSTYDGLSIAWAVIEYLTEYVRAKTLFATHYHELTELENSLDGIKNYKIAVKELNGSIVFLRKIMRGGANRSFGIEVASLAGVPKIVTDRAKTILKKIEKGEVNIIAEVQEQQNQQQSEVERILSQTDINALSPMQAFMLLGDLIEKVKNG